MQTMATAPLAGPADSWTAWQIRCELMSFLTNSSGTYTSPQYKTDGVPASEYRHAEVSLVKEGYAQKAASGSPATVTPKGAKLATEWAAKGMVIDRSA
jgi:hypothetical protein